MNGRASINAVDVEWGQNTPQSASSSLLIFGRCTQTTLQLNKVVRIPDFTSPTQSYAWFANNGFKVTRGNTNKVIVTGTPLLKKFTIATRPKWWDGIALQVNPSGYYYVGGVKTNSIAGTDGFTINDAGEYVITFTSEIVGAIDDNAIYLISNTVAIDAYVSDEIVTMYQQSFTDFSAKTVNTVANQRFNSQNVYIMPIANDEVAITDEMITNLATQDIRVFAVPFPVKTNAQIEAVYSLLLAYIAATWKAVSTENQQYGSSLVIPFNGVKEVSPTYPTILSTIRHIEMVSMPYVNGDNFNYQLPSYASSSFAFNTSCLAIPFAGNAEMWFSQARVSTDRSTMYNKVQDDNAVLAAGIIPCFYVNDKLFLDTPIQTAIDDGSGTLPIAWDTPSDLRVITIRSVVSKTTKQLINSVASTALEDTAKGMLTSALTPYNGVIIDALGRTMANATIKLNLLTKKLEIKINFMLFSNAYSTNTTMSIQEFEFSTEPNTNAATL